MWWVLWLKFFPNCQEDPLDLYCKFHDILQTVVYYLDWDWFWGLTRFILYFILCKPCIHRNPSVILAVTSNSGSFIPWEEIHFVHHEQFRPKSSESMQLKKWLKTIACRLHEWTTQTFCCRYSHHGKRGCKRGWQSSQTATARSDKNSHVIPYP